MRISLSSYEVAEAVISRIKEKYGMSIDADSITEASLEYQVREYVYAKYRNGQFIKDQHGHKTIDSEKSKWKTEFVDCSDSEFHFYVD